MQVAVLNSQRTAHGKLAVDNATILSMLDELKSSAAASADGVSVSSVRAGEAHQTVTIPSNSTYHWQ